MPADELERVAAPRVVCVALRPSEWTADDDEVDDVLLADADVLCTGKATLPMVNGGCCWPARTMTIPATTNASTIASATRDCCRRCSGLAAGNPRRCKDNDIAAQCYG